MRYLKTFESFSGNEIVNEELFGLSKNEKAEKKFREDNKQLFTDLKNAENALDKSDQASKEKLGNIQKELYSKLHTFTKAGGELMNILGIQKVDSDYTQVRTDLKNSIMNVNPFDNRSEWEKFVSGASSGREGWTAGK